MTHWRKLLYILQIKTPNVIDQLGKGSCVQVHHLIEQRFATLLGQNVNDMLSIVVTRTEHDVFTQVHGVLKKDSMAG